jgi:hypothetical protein
MENTTTTVPGAQREHPVTVIIPHPERSNRWLALSFLLLMIPKVLILLPHFLVLWALGIVAFVYMVLAQFVVLFTGRYPKGMHEFVANVLRWQVRVSAYFMGLCDTYPPFQLK